jgi:RHS repeat-associated protein
MVCNLEKLASETSGTARTSSFSRPPKTHLSRRSLLAKTDPPSKNRVGGFQKNFSVRARIFPSQPVETVSETSAVFTETASGVLFYGYRYYIPELGRWPSRDPIEEEGGLNVYGFVDNDTIDYFDISGLIRGGPRFGPGNPPVQYHPKPGHTFQTHTHFRWYNVGRDGQRFLKPQVTGGAPTILLHLKVAFNNISTRAIPAGPAVAGSGAAAIAYLAYKNVEMRYEIQRLDAEIQGNGIQEKNVSLYWRGRMKKWTQDIIDELPLPCCDKTAVNKCAEPFHNIFGNRAAFIGIGYVRDTKAPRPHDTEEMLYQLGMYWDFSTTYDRLMDCLAIECPYDWHH